MSEVIDREDVKDLIILKLGQVICADWQKRRQEFTIMAQGETGTTSTGGQLILRPGTK